VTSLKGRQLALPCKPAACVKLPDSTGKRQVQRRVTARPNASHSRREARCDASVYVSSTCRRRLNVSGYWPPAGVLLWRDPVPDLLRHTWDFQLLWSSGQLAAAWAGPSTSRWGESGGCLHWMLQGAVDACRPDDWLSLKIPSAPLLLCSVLETRLPTRTPNHRL